VKVQAASVRSEFARQTAAVRDAFLQLPMRLAPVLTGETNQSKIQTLLDTEIRRALTNFSS
jgi:hypothetical protein